MISIREKIGFILSTDSANAFNNAMSTPPSSAIHTDVNGDVIELVIDTSNDRYLASDVPKKRADTAETEISFPLQSTSTREESRLEHIGSYDADECVIWCSDSAVSFSDEDEQMDPIDTNNNIALSMSTFDTDSVFAEADSMLGLHKTESFKKGCRGLEKRTKRNKNINRFRGRGFFSFQGGRTKSDFFSRSNNHVALGNNNDKSISTTTSAARSRKFFSVSKVPSSIAEESSCNTPSSTSASVASSP